MKKLCNLVAVAVSFSEILGCSSGDVANEQDSVMPVQQAIEDGSVISNPSGVEKAIVNVSGCTGTLLSSKWVITARHCVVDNILTPRATSVWHGLTGSEQSVSASNVYLHPDPLLDVALLKLTTPISVTPSTIPLFTGEDATVVGKTVTTYGYGSIDNIANGCSNGQSCPTNYFCEDTGNCIRWPSLLAFGCSSGKQCPANYECIDNAHCRMKVAGFSKASFVVDKVVRDGSMQGTAAYNGLYLSISNAQGKHFNGGDSGGPTFINGELVGITGGGTWVAYAKAFRNWANAIMNPPTNNHINTTRTTFFYNVAPTGSILKTGDVNNDGYTDLIQFNQTTAPVGNVYVILGSAAGYTAMNSWHTNFSSNAQKPEVADVNGDGKADIVTFDQSTGKVYVALSSGTAFGNRTQWHSSFSLSGETPRLGDVNGDARADAVTFKTTGEVRVALSCGTNTSQFPAGCSATSQFGSTIQWATGFSVSGDVPFAGDVNQDGLADLVNFSAGTAYVALSSRQSCTTDASCTNGGVCMPNGQCSAFGAKAASKKSWGSGYYPNVGETVMLADMNGDGTLDAVDFETVTGARNGYFGVGLSTGTSFGSYSVWATGFCAKGHTCVTGDANRDGRTDIFDFIPAGNDSFSLSLP